MRCKYGDFITIETQETKDIYHFGKFRLDARERILKHGDKVISLAPKRFDLLLYFVENANRVTTKSELLDAVWSDTFIEEATMMRNVSWLRKKLGKFEGGENLIETVPKIGYRFTAEITRSAGENELIIEEQSVEYQRIEETIEFIDETIEDKEIEESKIANVSPAAVPSSRRSLPASVPLLVLIIFTALAMSSYVFYQNVAQAERENSGLSVKPDVAFKDIAVDAEQEIVDTGIIIQSGDVIDIFVDGEYRLGTNQTFFFKGEETAEPSPDFVFPDAAPWSLIGWIGSETNKNGYFQVSESSPVTASRNGNLYFAVNHRKSKNTDLSGGFIINVALTRAAAAERPEIKVGSVVHLKNQFSDDAGYLDAWGNVADKPEFSQVPTELTFVSTHPNPNRDNGSGSWKIVSATGKPDGETLVYGDKIHLLNMHPDAGYLDNCGWVKDLPVFKDFADEVKFAVFTAHSEDRDNGTGTWIVSSRTRFEGSPVFEGDGIALVNGFPEGGFLDSHGSVSNIPAFYDYEGSRLVFIHESSTSRRPSSGIWTITASNAAQK